MTTTTERLDFALALADEADALTMRHYRTPLAVERKSDGTLVTAADTEVEALVRARIRERFPDDAILGEEQGYEAPRPRTGDGRARLPARWIVDPVDGTHNFARGIPVWATLIACERDGVIEIGVASAPALGTRWWAGRGLGAWRGATSATGARAAGGGAGERIHVSARDRVDDAQVLYGSYRLVLERWGARADTLLRESWRQRGLGDFWGHCLVAEGGAEVMLEGAISPWDIAALLPIIEEAGGRLTDGTGIATIEAGYCIVTNGALHDEVLRRLRA